MKPSAGRARSPSALPETEQLLVEGGDARILLDPDAGVNKYGCPPFPDPEMAAFGSSTASIVSEAGFAAAEGLRRRLLGALDTASPAAVYAAELDRVRRELLGLCGLADLPGVEVLFAASGTDLHLLAAQLTAGSTPGPALVVTVEEGETGSGVPAALAGRHFSTRSPSGERVSQGELLSVGRPIETASVALRDADGALRTEAAVDGEFETLVARAAAQGRRVLLVPADLTKSGCLAPSPRCVLSLQNRFFSTIDILIDACQFRLAPATLRAYLETGFMVALTGSKFLSGPSFSGALLVPPSAARRWRQGPLLPALRPYSVRADWPRGWNPARGMGDRGNFGLLLRWEAALAELRAFCAVPEQVVAAVLEDLTGALRRRLTSDPHFEEVPAPRLDRRPLTESSGWDRIRTIFPFLLHRPCGEGGWAPLSREETARVYALLPQALADLDPSPSSGRREGLGDFRCQLGQPVACGRRGAEARSALRLCLSARLVVEAAQGNGAAALKERIFLALDKTAALADRESGAERTE